VCAESLTIPKVVCVGWYSLDVLFTSSTIIHLCMISVDRFMTLTYPLRYGHGKKKTHTMFKIALVWVLSFCIAGPLFVLSMWDQQVDSVEVINWSA
jgi:7 transmembrane receptor (rhodopsin family)